MMLQIERRESSRRALLEATLQLVGERGLFGFSLADVGERAGVSRGLATHHFKSREELVRAAAGLVTIRDQASLEPGLPGLIAWTGAELSRAAAGNSSTRACLQMFVADASPVLEGLRADYWRSRTDFLQTQLEQAKALQQVRREIDPMASATTLLAQIHGEQFRLANGGAPIPSAFIEHTRRGLEPPADDATRLRKRVSKTPAPGDDTQPRLFPNP
jgi:AcrR family transcriptional regulator